MKTAAMNSLAKAKELGTNSYLADCSKLKGGHTIADLYDLIIHADVNPQTFREAVIIPTDKLQARDVEFWQTACLNRGLMVSLFYDRESALQWLIQTSSGKQAH